MDQLPSPQVPISPYSAALILTVTGVLHPGTGFAGTILTHHPSSFHIVNTNFFPVQTAPGGRLCTTPSEAAAEHLPGKLPELSAPAFFLLISNSPRHIAQPHLPIFCNAFVGLCVPILVLDQVLCQGVVPGFYWVCVLVQVLDVSFG